MPVPAEEEEAAWVCTQCGQGIYLDGARGPVSQEIHYASGVAPNTPGKPFWVAEGRVVMQRAAFQGGSKPSAEASQFWSQARRFFVPAFQGPLDEQLRLGMQWVRQPPGLTEGPPVPFLPVRLYKEDVLPAVEFIVMAIEAERADKVKQVQFSLELSEPVLWIFP
jgi:hypothetical protein